MVELKGSLAGIGLPAILQLIGELRHTGTLQLVKPEAKGELAFDNGRLVGAECGERRGLQAVATCAREFADAEFTFMEGGPRLDRSLDLGPADVKNLLGRVTSGEFDETNTVPAISNSSENELESACRMLGFADDRDRHYSRPTALHRCYASGAPSLVSSQEQRDLCLSGRFAACPRYRNLELTSPTAITSDEPLRVVPRTAPPQPTVPPRVAARLSAVSQMRITPATSVPQDAPPRAVRETPLDSTAAKAPEKRRPPRRLLMLIGAGALLGFLLGTLALVVVLPKTAQQPAAPALAPLESSSQVPANATRPTPVTAAGVQATAAPTPAPRPTVSSRQATPVAAARPTVGPSPNSVIDVRFAASRGDGWTDNPPYAAWSDGAYRFQAKQAARFVAVDAPLDREFGDIVVSGTFRKTGGPPGGGYGLIVRDQGPQPRDGFNQDANAYVFETGDLGEFGVWRRNGDHWVDLVPWTRSNAVRPGGSPNELMVRAIGDQFTFLVNGVQLATLQDDTLLTGGIGVFVGGDYNEVALDRFSAQSPD